MANLSERLKMLRNEKKLPQQQLGDELDIPRTTVSSWESGTRIPELAAVQKLADFYQVSVDYLLGRSDVRNPEVTNEATRNIYTAIQNDPNLAEYIEKLAYREDLKDISRKLKDLPEKSIIRLSRVITAIEED